jgi:hypothetical protein
MWWTTILVSPTRGTSMLRLRGDELICVVVVLQGSERSNTAASFGGKGYQSMMIPSLSNRTPKDRSKYQLLCQRYSYLCGMLKPVSILGSRQVPEREKYLLPTEFYRRTENNKPPEAVADK